MKSPITGKEMVIKVEKAEFIFQNQKVIIDYHYYYCKDTKESFTDEKLDEINFNQIFKIE